LPVTIRFSLASRLPVPFLQTIPPISLPCGAAPGWLIKHHDMVFTRTADKNRNRSQINP